MDYSPNQSPSESHEEFDHDQEKTGANILQNNVNPAAQLHQTFSEEVKDSDSVVTSVCKANHIEASLEDTDAVSDMPRSQSINDALQHSSNSNGNNIANHGGSNGRATLNHKEAQRKGSTDETAFYRNRRQGSVSRRYKRTACFVHSLLEVQRGFEKSSMNSVPPSEPPSRSTSPPPSSRELERQAIDSKKDLFTHLSKKEISDMALGVRELSKHLGSARLKLNIHHILIVTKTGDKSLIGLTRDIAKWLLSRRKERKDNHSGSATPPNREERALGYTVYIEKTLENEPEVQGLKDGSSLGKLKYWTPELCTRSPHLFDFVVTLGGDGTVLYTSWLFQRIVPPVLSFALGSLGFMTMFDFADHENVIKGVLRDGVTAALRMRIECTVYRANRHADGTLVTSSRDLHEEIINTDHHGEESEPTHTAHQSFSVLNDLVVDRGPNPFMSSTELYGDDEHLTSINADGVVISTPTGSTAYSLSAGGSLCHPEIPAILISPICPHTLSFRPLLVPDSMVLRVTVPYDSRSTAWASFDGRNRVELKQGDYVRISASRFPYPTCLRGKQTGDWFESVSRTLNWNERKKQKPVQ